MSLDHPTPRTLHRVAGLPADDDVGFVVSTGDFIELLPEQVAQYLNEFEATAQAGPQIGAAVDDGVEVYDAATGQLVGFVPVALHERHLVQQARGRGHQIGILPALLPAVIPLAAKGGQAAAAAIQQARIKRLRNLAASGGPKALQAQQRLDRIMAPRAPQETQMSGGLFGSVYGGSVVGNDEIGNYWNDELEPKNIGSDDPGDPSDVSFMIALDQEIAGWEDEIAADNDVFIGGDPEEIGNANLRRQRRMQRMAQRAQQAAQRASAAQSRGRGRRAARLLARQQKLEQLARGSSRKDARRAARTVRRDARSDRREARRERREARRAPVRSGTSRSAILEVAPDLPPEGSLVVLPMLYNSTDVYKFSFKTSTSAAVSDTKSWLSEGIPYAELRLIGTMVELSAYAADTSKNLGAEILQFQPDGRVSALYGPQVDLADPDGFSDLAGNDFATFFMRLIVIGLRDKGRIEKTNKIAGQLRVFAPAQATGTVTGQYTFAAVCDVLEDEAAALSR